MEEHPGTYPVPAIVKTLGLLVLLVQVALSIVLTSSGTAKWGRADSPRIQGDKSLNKAEILLEI
jgi:hypothetical protein